MSYYDVVDTMVVAHDQDAISWTGERLDLEPCREIVERLDRDRKVRFLPGLFHGGDKPPLELETFERNAAVSALGDSVDWILQIDTDEVVASPSRLVESIARAEAHGLSAVEFPARWLYGHVGGRRYLERCRRLWGVSAGFPGPVAVRGRNRAAPRPPVRRARLAGRLPAPQHRPGPPVARTGRRVDRSVRGDLALLVGPFGSPRCGRRRRPRATHRRIRLERGDRPVAVAVPTPASRDPADSVPAAPFGGRRADLATDRVPSGAPGECGRMSMPSASVVVITYERPDFLARCLEHLARADDAARGGHRGRLLGGTRDGRARRRAVPVGALRGVPRGQRGDGDRPRHRLSAGAPARWWPSSTTTRSPSRNGSSRLLVHFADPTVGGVGGRQIREQPGELTEGVDAIGRLLPDGTLTGNFAADPGRAIEVDHLLGASMSFRRSVIDELGGIHDGYRGTCVREETDLCLRVGRSGLPARSTNPTRSSSTWPRPTRRGSASTCATRTGRRRTT